ncbi:MAG: LacI family transcriptional regulator [Solirubrobacteraceae bacterium]|nr:LacI family transcriptional regulator [Solirubrobacteraceae bacterium]
MPSAPERTGSRPPRIRDVAARAGVGVGTVSRVLNDAPGVAAATRERVRAVMEELGYRPSVAARNLSLGRTQTLGVIAPFFTQASVVERLRGVDEVVGQSPYHLTICNVETREQRRDVMRRFARRDRLDGVLVISLPPTDAEAHALRRDGLAVVLVDAIHGDLPHVVVDDVAGGALAARHLLDAGHRRIAFVGDVEDNPFGFASSERRLRGLRREVERTGLELPPEYVRRGPFGRETAGGMALDLLALAEPPTAVFAASDVQAFGVLDAAARAGLSVPGDLSVIGYDDIELAGAIGLTTVRQPLRESGRLGASLLLRALEDELSLDEHHDLGGLAVVERRTTGQVPCPHGRP